MLLSGITKFTCENFKGSNATQNDINLPLSSYDIDKINDPNTVNVLRSYSFELLVVQGCYAILNELKYVSERFKVDNGTTGMLFVTDYEKHVKSTMNLKMVDNFIQPSKPNIHLDPGDRVFVELSLFQGPLGIGYPKFENHVVMYERNETTNKMQIKSSGKEAYKIYVPLKASVDLGTKIEPVRQWEDIACEKLVNGTDNEGFKVQEKTCMELKNNKVVEDTTYCPQFHLSVRKCNYYLGVWSKDVMQQVSECQLFKENEKCGNGFFVAESKCVHNNSSIDASLWKPTCEGQPPVYVQSCYVRCTYPFKKAVNLTYMNDVSTNNNIIDHPADDDALFEMPPNSDSITINLTRAISMKKVLFYRGELLFTITMVPQPDNQLFEYAGGDDIVSITYANKQITIQGNPLQRKDMYKIKIFAESPQDTRFGNWSGWQNQCTDVDGRHGHDTRTTQCEIYNAGEWREKPAQYCKGTSTQYKYCSANETSVTYEGECKEKHETLCFVQMNPSESSDRCSIDNPIHFPNKERCFDWQTEEGFCTDPCNNHHETMIMTQQCLPITKPLPTVTCQQNATQTLPLNVTCMKHQCNRWELLQRDVCFGSRDEQYGQITIQTAGHLSAISLVHRSGGISCDVNNWKPAYFGCDGKSYYTKETLCTWVTDTNKNRLFPSTSFVTDISEDYYYNMPPYHAYSKVLVLRKQSPLSVNAGDEFRVYFGEDLADKYEYNNIGTSCVDVYVCTCGEHESCDNNGKCLCDDGYRLIENICEEIWTECNTTCGVGVQWTGNLSRICQSNETCPIYGEAKWGVWSGWSECSVTCDKGIKQKSRKCFPSTIGEFCTMDPHNDIVTEQCDTFVACPGACIAEVAENCNSRCSQHSLHCVSIDFDIEQYFEEKVNCSGGYHQLPPFPGYFKSSGNCSAVVTEYSCENTEYAGFHRVCNCQPEAEIVYGEWSSWGECNEPCDWGTRSRSRESVAVYNNVSHKHSEPCKIMECTVSGLWSDWGSWSACSKTCGNGVRSRIRQCDNPPPAYGGLDCPGLNNQTQYCGDLPIICPVDGGWSNWSLPLDCDKPCGNGTTKRVRDCNNPAPEFGGKTCVGEKEKLTPCNTHECKKVELNVAVEFIGEDDNYVPGYNNPKSEPSQAYARKIEENMKKMYAEHNISTNFRVVIHEIKEGG